MLTRLFLSLHVCLQSGKPESIHYLTQVADHDNIIAAKK